MNKHEPRAALLLAVEGYSYKAFKYE